MSQPCGCRISVEDPIHLLGKETIVYCPLHLAAGELLEAAKIGLRENEECDGHGHAGSTEARMRLAIAHAEGKKTTP